jgi:hypothetical protein
VRIRSSNANDRVSDYLADNITYYKCDVSKWEEVEAVSKKIVEEVSSVTMISPL